MGRSEPASRPRLRASWRPVVFVLALLATALPSGCGGSDYPETPEAVVEKFEQAWNAWSDQDGGDPDAVCELLTEDAIAAIPATSRDDCSSVIRRFWRTEGSDQSSDISLDVGEIVDTDEASGRAAIRTENDWTFTLEEQDGEWKLAGWPFAASGRDRAGR